MSIPARKRTPVAPPAKKAVKKVAKKPALTHKERAIMANKAAMKTKTDQTAARKARFLEVFEGAACNVSHACKAIGICRQTFMHWRSTDAHFAKKVSELKEGLIDFAESMLFKKIKEGDNTANIFFLKCQAKDRGYIERVEHSGPGGSPIHHKHGFDMEWLNEELPAQALASIVRKLGGKL